jgi:hypothetical protein
MIRHVARERTKCSETVGSGGAKSGPKRTEAREPPFWNAGRWPTNLRFPSANRGTWAWHPPEPLEPGPVRDVN